MLQRAENVADKKIAHNENDFDDRYCLTLTGPCCDEAKACSTGDGCPDKDGGFNNSRRLSTERDISINSTRSEPAPSRRLKRQEVKMLIITSYKNQETNRYEHWNAISR